MPLTLNGDKLSLLDVIYGNLGTGFFLHKACMSEASRPTVKNLVNLTTITTELSLTAADDNGETPFCLLVQKEDNCGTAIFSLHDGSCNKTISHTIHLPTHKGFAYPYDHERNFSFKGQRLNCGIHDTQEYSPAYESNGVLTEMPPPYVEAKAGAQPLQTSQELYQLAIEGLIVALRITFVEDELPQYMRVPPPGLPELPKEIKDAVEAQALATQASKPKGPARGGEPATVRPGEFYGGMPNTVVSKGKSAVAAAHGYSSASSNPENIFLDELKDRIWHGWYFYSAEIDEYILKHYSKFNHIGGLIHELIDYQQRHRRRPAREFVKVIKKIELNLIKPYIISAQTPERYNKGRAMEDLASFQTNLRNYATHPDNNRFNIAELILLLKTEWNIRQFPEYIEWNDKPYHANVFFDSLSANHSEVHWNQKLTVAIQNFLNYLAHPYNRSYNKDIKLLWVHIGTNAMIHLFCDDRSANTVCNMLTQINGKSETEVFTITYLSCFTKQLQYPRKVTIDFNKFRELVIKSRCEDMPAPSAPPVSERSMAADEKGEPRF